MKQKTYKTLASFVRHHLRDRVYTLMRERYGENQEGLEKAREEVVRGALEANPTLDEGALRQELAKQRWIILVSSQVTSIRSTCLD